MKTRGLFLSALLMGAVMVGCSQEDVMNVDNERDIKKSENFIAVNIVAPTDFGSRGTSGENDYLAGSAAENEVKDAWFVFFAENGRQVDAVPATELKWSDGTGTIEKISTAVIVLENPQEWPTQVVALLNTGFTKSDLNGKSLAHVQAMAADYRDYQNFVMSNSVYNDGEKNLYATPLSAANICDTKDKALDNPVSIPVERVLAKVEASFDDNFKVVDPDVTPQLDGEDVAFVPTITGMALVNTNPRSYLLKNIEGVENFITWPAWNDPTNFRSYWAMSVGPDPNGVLGYETLSYEDVVAKGITDDFMTYTHENTVASIGSGDLAIKLLVTAQFKASGTEEYQTIIKYNGTYFTVDGLKNYLNAQYFASIKHGEDNSNEWRNHMAFVSAGTDNEWEVELALVADGETPVPAANDGTDLNDILTSINSKTMSQWTDGKCYYYVDVEHFGAGGAEIGVVRNHWYDISLKSIKGLGTPVFDPTKDITPDKPEEENYYVAAEIKILKWKMVTQEVDLQ